MRTLFISHLFPHPPNTGANQRIFHLLRAVAKVSEVTLVCELPPETSPPDISPLREFVSEVHWIPRETTALYKDLQRPFLARAILGKLRYFHFREPVLLQWERSVEGQRLVAELCKRSYDLVWAERLIGFRLLPPDLRSRIIVDLDDLEHRKLAHRLRAAPVLRMLPLEFLEFWRLRTLERSMARSVHRVLVCSSFDKHLLGGSHVDLVPNGVDLPLLAPSSPPRPEVPTFTFVGYMGYPPNIDAVSFFARRVFPRVLDKLPQAKFNIVGRDPDVAVQRLHNGRNIVVTGTVPTIEPYLRASTACIVPIRFGAGTRIKILEALAFRTPVVTTRVGAEGLDIQANRHALVADSPRMFAEACVRLHEDGLLAQRLSDAGSDLVRLSHSWDVIERGVLPLVWGALDERGAHETQEQSHVVPVSGGARGDAR